MNYMNGRIGRWICAAVTALGIFTGCSKPKYAWNTEEEYFLLPYWSQRVKTFKKIKKEPHTAKLFIGDSITEGFDLVRFFNDEDVVNMGISGDFTSGVLMRLEAVEKLQPKTIFIMIGINDILKNVPDARIHENYKKIIVSIRAICPDAHLFVQSVLPTNNMGGSPESNALVIARIRDLNTMLDEQCLVDGATFINLYSIFEMDGTHLNPDYTYDGLHVNEEGYKVWSAFIRQLV